MFKENKIDSLKLISPTQNSKKLDFIVRRIKEEPWRYFPPQRICSIQFLFLSLAVEPSFLAIKVLLSVSTFQLRLRTRFRDIKPQHNLFNLKDYFLNLKPEVYLPERSLFSSHSRERRAKFVRLNCYYNKNVRCVKVEATRADRDIQDSRFSYLEVTMHRGSSLSLITHINASLRIAKSFFHKNKEDNRKVSWRLSSLTLLFLLQSE